jgi:hypothetical protein
MTVAPDATEAAIDQVLAELIPKEGQKLHKRMSASEVRSHLSDLCVLLECHFLDLPVQIADIAMRDGNTSRTELVDHLLELRDTPMIAA